MDHRVKQSISTLICALGLCAFSFFAQAVEVKSVRIDETAKVGGQSLLLNGSGLQNDVKSLCGCTLFRAKTNRCK
jgi:hypothetical protein